MEMEFTDNNFFEEVLKSEGAVLVDFWAPWCGPCQMMGPVIEELSKEFEGKAKVGKCNVDGNQNTASEYGIMSIPSIKIFKAGKVAKEFVGVQSKETLTAALQELV
jgi:thioredoxin 1